MRYTANDCVGCPDGCRCCGRDRNYTVVQCDKCMGTAVFPARQQLPRKACQHHQARDNIRGPPDIKHELTSFIANFVPIHPGMSRVLTRDRAGTHRVNAYA